MNAALAGLCRPCRPQDDRPTDRGLDRQGKAPELLVVEPARAKLSPSSLPRSLGSSSGGTSLAPWLLLFFFINRFSASEARQAEGKPRGAVCNPRTRRAVHTFRVWAGGLCTADGIDQVDQTALLSGRRHSPGDSGPRISPGG